MTTICEHLDYDEYFEKCSDCGANKRTVLIHSFKGSLQDIYTQALTALGIEGGDIDPVQAIRLERAEDALAGVFADWLITRSEEE